MSLGWSIVGVAGLTFQTLLVWLLLKGPYRKYPFLLVYCVAQTITTAAELGLVFGGAMNTRIYSRTYWIDDAVTKLLLFLLVIASTYQAMEGNPTRAALGRFLAVIVLVVALIPLVFFEEPVRSARWLNRTAGFLSFAAAILNLFLWSALLRQRRRDMQLLLVSAGLGLEVTAAAIAYSLRQLVPRGSRWVTLPDTLLVATHFLTLFIWWKALRLTSTPGASESPSTQPGRRS